MYEWLHCLDDLVDTNFWIFIAPTLHKQSEMILELTWNYESKVWSDFLSCFYFKNKFKVISLYPVYNPFQYFYEVEFWQFISSNHQIYKYWAWSVKNYLTNQKMNGAKYEKKCSTYILAHINFKSNWRNDVNSNLY